MFQIKFYCLVFLRITICAARMETSINLTDFLQHRQKRALIFQGSGTVKFTAGPTLPVDLGDPIAWRSTTVSYNFHCPPYGLPTKPLYPWDKFENQFARSTNNFDSLNAYREDDSRLFVYVALETYMSRQQVDGPLCLLRSICENAQVDQHMGVFSEVLNIILTPGKDNLEPVYRQAFEAGRSGADCQQLYYGCPRGDSVLDRYFDEY